MGDVRAMFHIQRMIAPNGTEHTTLASQSNKLWHFIKGADAETPQWKRTNVCSNV